MRKRIIIRITLITLLVLIGIFLYTIGKEHKVIIDNRDISVGDITYSLGTTYMVRVDNQEIGLFEKGERKVARVSGVSHKIVVEEIKDNVLTGEKYEKKFKLKISESATVNIPAMINNANEWIDKTN
ncbi:unnamed protein product [marine sediment metagenome]|uniref:Uncharacterized protein n=1 Tax=marine sediment metagenome TaxID=412755 RepID=X1JY98_9ZZZZ